MYTVVVQRTLRERPETVWRYLSEPSHLASWMGDVDRLEEGAAFRLDFGDGDFHRGRVLELHPRKSLRYRWTFLDMGPSFDVTWAILPRRSGTVVSVVDRGALTQDDAECLRVGWTEFLIRLEQVVDGGAEDSRFDWRPLITFTGRLTTLPGRVSDALSDPSWYREYLDGCEVGLLRLDPPLDVRARLRHPRWGDRETRSQMVVNSVDGTVYLDVTHAGWEGLPAESALVERKRFLSLWTRAARESLCLV